MYRCQLNFAMFFVISVLGISWQHLHHPSLLFCSVYRFYVHFDVQIMLHQFGFSLPHEDGFSKVKTFYIKDASYSIFDEYSVNVDETWMNRNWFYTTKYGASGYGRKAANISTTNNLTRWIIAKYKDFIRKRIGKISRSVTAYIYYFLILHSR